MVSQQRSLPRLDGCVTFEADAVRVGDTRVHCHVEQGSVVVVLGDRLRPLTLGERALAVSLGADGLARAVWQLSGGGKATARSTAEQAIVEAVALHLAGAANAASLHLSLIVAARSLGDPAAAQALGATIADSLAAGLATDVPEGSPEAGWTVLDFDAPAETDGPEAELHDPVAVRDALAAALWQRATLPLSREMAEATSGHPTASGTALAPDPDPAAAVGNPAARSAPAPSWSVPTPPPDRVAAPAASQRHVAHGVPADAVGSAAPPSDAGGPFGTVATASRFPAWSPSLPAEPDRAVTGAARAAWAFTSAPVDSPPVSSSPGDRPHPGAEWRPTAIGRGEPARQVLTGIDWQSVPVLDGRPALNRTDDGPGQMGRTGTPNVTGRARLAERPARAPDDGALMDAAPGLSEQLAEQLLAAADRRGLA